MSAGKKQLAIAQNVLAYLVASEDGPRFHDQWRARAAEDGRDAVLAELKTQADDLRYVDEAEFDDPAQTAVASWSHALAALRDYPAAKLPDEG